MDCIFCAIAGGDIPAATIYEDASTMAFLDIGPLTEGHALVIPRQHAQRLSDLDETAAAALMVATRRVNRALGATLGTTDATIAIHDGPHAGQEVPHLHAHIVPRREHDGGGPIHALFEKASADPDDITALAQRIRATMETTA